MVSHSALEAMQWQLEDRPVSACPDHTRTSHTPHSQNLWRHTHSSRCPMLHVAIFPARSTLNQVGGLCNTYIFFALCCAGSAGQQAASRPTAQPSAHLTRQLRPTHASGQCCQLSVVNVIRDGLLPQVDLDALQAALVVWTTHLNGAVKPAGNNNTSDARAMLHGNRSC